MVNTSNFTFYIYLNIRLCITKPTFIDLNPDKYNQGLCNYPFMVNLDRCNTSCNNLDDTSVKIFVPNKRKDVNLSVFL